MKFRRRSEPVDDELGFEDDPAGDEADEHATGPFDSEEPRPRDELERVDLGSLLIAPEPDRELRLQVDEASGTVQAVLLAGQDGAAELRAFAAPRNGDLWTEVRPRIAADIAQSGGIATEREGPFGPELVAQVGTGRGRETQTTRIIGVNGPRWLLRATVYGRPAAEPDRAADWEASIRSVVVHRGSQAVPPGEALPLSMPPQLRPAE